MTRGPRQTCAPRAELVTQSNCQAVMGLPPRKHLELVRTLDIPHRRIGSLVAVAVEDYLRALDHLRPAEPEPAEVTDLDAVRQQMGYRTGT